MNRRQLEHVLRASGSISGSSDIVVIGSQSILGAHPNASDELCASMEADVYPADDPGKADLIDGCIGELSPFHERFGYYAHGVGPDTAVLAPTWKSRAVRVQNENTGGITGWCLAPEDLAVSKLAAGRPKDIEFVRRMVMEGLVDGQAIRRIVNELDAASARDIASRLTSCLASG